MALRRGDTLGLYRIDEPLGIGGMGQVYRAWDPRLHRWVAIKVLPQHAANSSARKRFEIEAKAVAALSHPNILVIYDVGAHDNLHFAVTELLEGETLRSRLDRGRVPWQESIRIAASITDGLAAAHAKGVVHRDLKPENIFLTWDERIKILDFGLAFFDVRLNPTAPATRPTPPGAVIGTSGYMAPEQFLGEEVDHRADLFALGCLLYEMLSGQAAFPSRSIGEAVIALLERDPPRLESLVSDLPPELPELVARCLAKAPEDRFHLAAAAGVALRRLEPDPESSPGLEGLVPPIARQPVRTLAVLPLDAAGEPSAAEHWTDGLSEAIIRGLARQRDLRVMAWGTTSRYKRSPLPPHEIGRALAVDAVLTGRVLDNDERLVVTVELVSSRDGELLWGEKYDRRVADVFEVREEIAERIARHLQRRAGEAPERPARRETTSSEAYRLYLRGRFFWNRRTPDRLERGKTCFDQALEQDASFALAYSGLADTYNGMPFWGLASPREAFTRSKAAARRAIEIDPWLAEARASMAYVHFYFDWDWPAAVRGYKKALELQPDYTAARQWYGVCAAHQQDFETAFDQLDRAQEIDPLSLTVHADQALVWYLKGDPERAIEVCRAAQDLDPSFAPAYLYHGLGLEQVERYDDAAEELDQAVELTGHAAPAVAALAHCLALGDEREQAEKTLRKLLETAQTRYVSSYHVAAVYSGLGSPEEAWKWLERALEERSEMMAWFETDPRLEGLRSGPRAQDFLLKVNETKQMLDKLGSGSRMPRS